MTEPLHADAVEFAVQQWSDAGLPAGDSLELMSSLVRTNQLMTVRMEAALEEFDLNLSRYLVLMALLVAPHGAYRMGTLRWFLMVHHTSVTAIVDKLESRELVRREPDPADRRSTLVVLTPAGRRLARKASVRVGAANFGLPELPVHQQRALVDLLLQLRAGFGDLEEERLMVTRKRPR